METGDIPRQDPKLLAQELHFYIVGLIQEAKISNNLAVLDQWNREPIESLVRLVH